MERREEEAEDGERRIESKEDESIGILFELIPLDLIPDILLRLPAKSAARFRGVSKLWSSITTRPDFIRSFAIQSSTRLCLLACVKARDKRIFISLPQDENRDFDHYHANFTHNYVNEPHSESVHGLVCYGDCNIISVWNPSMRQYVTLPTPEPRFSNIRSCLGYDPVEGKYKVLCISGGRRRCKDPLVFTLGPQESWRVTKNSPLHIPTRTTGRLGICIDGHVYYEASIYFKVGNTYGPVKEMLVSFDVRYEKFNTIKKPHDRTLTNIFLSYQGKLAWFCHSFSSLTRFWVLEDVEKQEWSLTNFLLPFPTFPQRDPIFECTLQLRGVNHDTDELIFIATRFEAFYVVYYDLKRKRERRFEYEGLADWISNEFLYDASITYTVDWFPNHSESLMSLENVPCKCSNTSPCICWPIFPTDLQ